MDKDGSLWVAAQADNGGLLPADERYRRYDLWAGKIDNAHVPGGPVEREFLVAADDLRAPPAVRDSSPSRKRPLWKTYRMEADGKQYSLVWETFTAIPIFRSTATATAACTTCTATRSTQPDWIF